MKSLILTILLFSSLFALSANAEEMAGETKKTEPLSLITETPEEGFQVALRLARLGVTQTQPDKEVLFMLRDVYSKDPDALIAASHVVAVHFQTVAAANDYWRAGEAGGRAARE